MLPVQGMAGQRCQFMRQAKAGMMELPTLTAKACKPAEKYIEVGKESSHRVSSRSIPKLFPFIRAYPFSFSRRIYTPSNKQR